MDLEWSETVDGATCRPLAPSRKEFDSVFNDFGLWSLCCRATSDPSFIQVNFDVGSDDFFDEDKLKGALEAAVGSGCIDSFYVKNSGFSFRSVEGKSAFN